MFQCMKKQSSPTFESYVCQHYVWNVQFSAALRETDAYPEQFPAEISCLLHWSVLNCHKILQNLIQLGEPEGGWRFERATVWFIIGNS